MWGKRPTKTPPVENADVIDLFQDPDNRQRYDRDSLSAAVLKLRAEDLVRNVEVTAQLSTPGQIAQGPILLTKAHLLLHDLLDALERAEARLGEENTP